jgi:hypothetical protein
MTSIIIDIQDGLIRELVKLEDPNNPGEFPTASKNLEDCGFLSTDVPFFWVNRGRLLSRTMLAARAYQEVREFPVLLYVQELCKPSDGSNEAARTAAIEWIDKVYDFITVQSQAFKTGLLKRAELLSVTDTADVDLRAFDNQRIFAGVVFIMQIRYTRITNYG